MFLFEASYLNLSHVSRQGMADARFARQTIVSPASKLVGGYHLLLVVRLTTAEHRTSFPCTARSLWSWSLWKRYQLHSMKKNKSRTRESKMTAFLFELYRIFSEFSNMVIRCSALSWSDVGSTFWLHMAYTIGKCVGRQNVAAYTIPSPDETRQRKISPTSFTM